MWDETGKEQNTDYPSELKEKIIKLGQFIGLKLDNFIDAKTDLEYDPEKSREKATSLEIETDDGKIHKFNISTGEYAGFKIKNETSVEQ